MYYGDFESQAEEEVAYQNWCQSQEEQEPEVVPCFKCGGAMYQESGVPEENICKCCIMDKELKTTIIENIQYTQ